MVQFKKKPLSGISKRYKTISTRVKTQKGKKESQKVKIERGRIKKKIKRTKLTPGLSGLGRFAMKTGRQIATKAAGAGRPTGTYKHGMPISVYKKLMAQKRADLREYQAERTMQFAQRGVSPEQLREMQLRRTIEERFPRQLGKPAKGDGPERMVDDELEFDRWQAKNKLSPSAQAILIRLRRTQNKGKRDNIRQQRIHEERRIISDKGNMMHAHENMIKVDMDFTNVGSENILMAPSVFKEDPRENILRQNRPSVLNTGAGGNDLRF